MSGISAAGYGYNWYPAARSYANSSYANARMSGAFRRIAYSPVSRVPAVSLNLTAQAQNAAQAPVGIQAQSAAQVPVAAQTQSAVQAPVSTQAQNTAQAPVAAQAQRAASAASFPARPLPTAADLNNASEWMVRMRIQYPAANAETPAAVVGAGLPGAVSVPPSAAAPDGIEDPQPAGPQGIEDPKSPAEVMEEAECQTCAKRRYQDGSDDPGVSFKTPTRMNPDQAATAVRAHEQEHVVREQAKARREGREVVSQSVSLHTEICPECGRVYIAGGVTRTTTVAESDQAEQSDQNEGVSLDEPEPLSKAA